MVGRNTVCVTAWGISLITPTIKREFQKTELKASKEKENLVPGYFREMIADKKIN